MRPACWRWRAVVPIEDEAQAWLADVGALTRRAPEATDRPRWVEKPAAYSCHVCGGSGLVHEHVMRRFVDPTYQPWSTPVLCRRARICGMEERHFNDEEHGARQIQRNRYERTTMLPELPKPLADKIDGVLRAEARAAATDPDRTARAEAIAAIRRLTSGGRKWTDGAAADGGGVPERPGAGGNGDGAAGGGGIGPPPF